MLRTLPQHLRQCSLGAFLSRVSGFWVRRWPLPVKKASLSVPPHRLCLFLSYSTIGQCQYCADFVRVSRQEPRKQLQLQQVRAESEREREETKTQRE